MRENLFSFAWIELRIEPAQLLRLTPRFYAALVRRWEDAQKRDRHRAERSEYVLEWFMGHAIAMIGNTAWPRPDEPFKPMDFMPLQKKLTGSKTGKPRRISERELSRRLERTMNQAMAYQVAQAKRGMA